MGREHLRVFIATGTHTPFRRLLWAARFLVQAGGFDVFVQRGVGGADFVDLPGEDFIARETFAERLSWADVIVCHGGAGSLYEAYAAGHTPIVMPRLARHGEHVNDHQLELARALSLRGHAVLCETEDALPQLVHTVPVRLGNRTASAAGLTYAVRVALLDGAQRERGIFASLWGVSRDLVDRLIRTEMHRSAETKPSEQIRARAKT